MNNMVLLIGNPNVGKSTLFNLLTGMKQHTGNWTGKTVDVAVNKCLYKDFYICDLPGTYSLIPSSKEEEITKDTLLEKNYDSVIVVCDATCLERNLILVLQTLQVTNKVVVCVNLMDEALKKGIEINTRLLAYLLGIPVVGISARKKVGIEELLKEIDNIQKIEYKPLNIKYSDELEKILENIEGNSRWEKIDNILKNDNIVNKNLHNNDINILDETAIKIVKESENISKKVTKLKNIDYKSNDLKIDKIVTSKIYGIPIMLLLMSFIFFLTIKVSNYPSEILFNIFSYFERIIYDLLLKINIPNIIVEALVFGIYRVLTWVVSVMLPPMAIFFPLFTLLEDLGYLPRIAFNLDKSFKKCLTCGKQSLTMCMGFGCNAVGVTGARIIDSKRERIIAILTNSLVPCNGRFPILISIIMMFLFSTTIYSTLTLIVLILISIIVTFFSSFILSKTILKGLPSSFTLELPPYRKPEIKKVIISSILNRTLIVLGRAVTIAIPAGLIIWLFANTSINGITILNHISDFLDPFAKLIGLDGVILMAFILGFPANEIVIPIIIMGYMSLNYMVDISDLNQLKSLFIDNGWTIKTAICTLIFTLFHFPCSTTCLTIKKETNSWFYTIIGFILPFLIGTILCMIINIFF